ncbi:MAG: PepSY domain-containing protein [Blastocatellales bacterium]
MKTRRLHRITGLVMLLPLLGWAATGLVFFLKPGYEGAYEMLSVRTYPLTRRYEITPGADWTEARILRTRLGDHLLVRTSSGRLHLDPETMRPRPEPSEVEVRELLKDAFSANPARYGDPVNVSKGEATTSTGVEVGLDWMTLILQQKGPDTARIDALYRIHYLQWTGVKWLDRALGLAGLVLLVALSVLGLRLAFRRGTVNR